MKKVILLAVAVLVLMGCNSDDDQPQMNLEMVKARVLHAEFPESFEMGQPYQIKVYYQLPSACHQAAGVVVERGEVNSEYYIYGAAIHDADQVGCDLTIVDLEKEDVFDIFIENQGPYTFNLWVGFDENDEDIFEVIEVLVEGAE